ncbi:disco-interacting protein 2 homolog C-like [Menidia menidia]
MEHWISRALQGTSSTTTSSPSSSSSSSSSRSGGAASQHAHLRRHHPHRHQGADNHSAPPDVTGYTNSTPNMAAANMAAANMAAGAGVPLERPPGAAHRPTPKYGNAELMETGDGVPVSSRVSAKIQQLVNTLKRPKRPPLREFFVDDFEELLEVQQPDPHLPRAEGAPMEALGGPPLAPGAGGPPSLEAALQRWGTVSPKAPCLSTMDPTGKALHLLTYGKLWSRSVKVAFNLLHKLGTKQEPLVRAGDRVSSGAAGNRSSG